MGQPEECNRERSKRSEHVTQWAKEGRKEEGEARSKDQSCLLDACLFQSSAIGTAELN
jgi:hypothetical protein